MADSFVSNAIQYGHDNDTDIIYAVVKKQLSKCVMFKIVNGTHILAAVASSDEGA